MIAVNGIDHPGRRDPRRPDRSASPRAARSGALTADRASLAGAVGFQRATGIDSFGAPGATRTAIAIFGAGARHRSPDRRRAWAAGACPHRPKPVRWLRSGHLRARRHARQQPQPAGRGRVWADFGSASSAWSGRSVPPCSAPRIGIISPTSSQSYARDPPHLRRAGRKTLHHGVVTHRLIIAGESERETFHARDTFRRLRPTRTATAPHQSSPRSGERDAERLTGDVAVRRDIFNRFKDATRSALRSSAKLGGGFAVAGSYAEGSRSRPSSIFTAFSRKFRWKSIA